MHIMNYYDIVMQVTAKVCAISIHQLSLVRHQ